MAAYRIEDDIWSFSADVTHMELGWSERTERGRPSASLRTDQLAVMGTVGRQNTDAFPWYFGYRYISYDYETDSGANYQRYDLQQHGPGIGIALSFWRNLNSRVRMAASAVSEVKA